MTDWKTKVQPYHAKYSLRFSLLLLALYTAGLVMCWAIKNHHSSWYEGMVVGVWLVLVLDQAVRTLGVFLELRRAQRRDALSKEVPKVDLS